MKNEFLKAAIASSRTRFGSILLGVVGAGALIGSSTPSAYHSEQSSASISASTIQPDAAQATTPADARALSFYNTHSGETLTATYYSNGAYDPAALRDIGRVMRDRRSNETHEMNAETLDYVHAVIKELQNRYPNYRNNPMIVEIISGYRSTETLAQQRREGRDVAQGTSQHELGNAIDFRIRGIPLNRLRDTAWCMQRGGVGYYPSRHNQFIHVDVGRVRRWGPLRPRWGCG